MSITRSMLTSAELALLEVLAEIKHPATHDVPNMLALFRLHDLGLVEMHGTDVEVTSSGRAVLTR